VDSGVTEDGGVTELMLFDPGTPKAAGLVTGVAASVAGRYYLVRRN